MASLAQTPSADPLARARQLYNERKYDAAIEAASEARKVPSLANAAAIVYARAHLERYRQSSAAGDLEQAREALKQVYATKLTPRDHVEFLVGLGESLYLDGCLQGCFSGAAQLFESALARAHVIDDASRDLILEWWALALDMQAQYGPENERRPLYARMLRRVEQELERSDSSAVALYWLAASARGVGDLERAWGAAIAGWVRARFMGTRGTELRTDLDRFVTQVLLPERARQVTLDGDPRPALAGLQEQWEQLKKKYE